MIKATPIDEEIILDSKRYIVSKTDAKGKITFGNDYFIEISRYTKSELLGQPHSIIRHPDMPRIIFKLLWDRLESERGIMAVVKNLAKDGRYYWVTTEFEIKKDRVADKIIGYTAFRQGAPRYLIEAVIPLYAKLIEIEESQSMKESEKYLMEFLKDRGLNYDEYIDETIQNRGVFGSFFISMKKIFS